LIADHKYSYEDESKEKQELDNKQSEILQSFLYLLNLALQSGIPFDRWKKVHSIVLFKDNDNRYVHRIRNIHIYEADYNLILRLKWGEAIESAEKNDKLHPTQFGSRKSKRSLDPVILEMMLHEISRMTQTSYLQINYDAQACYDRIIPDIAFEVSKKYGIHPNVIKIARETMSKSKFFIKIGNIVSKKSYFSTTQQPLYGTGQGSGCSPHIWTMISSELFRIYTETSQGSTLVDPYGEHSTQLHMTAYVDDVNTHHSFTKSFNPSTMISQAQKAAQKWNDILHVSGGKLSTNKCNYYLATWQHASTGRPILQDLQHPNIVIRSRSDKEEDIIIKNISPFHSHKSLGYLQSIARPKEYQKQLLQSKTFQFKKTLRTTNLNFQETQIYYRTIYTPKLQYITHLSSLSTPELMIDTQKTIQIALQKMGFSSSTPKGIYFGHRKYGGLELLNLPIEQGARNLLTFTKGLSDTSLASASIKIAAKWWWFKIGVKDHPIQSKYDDEITKSSVWFYELKKFINTYKIRLKLDFQNYPLLRENDIYLMDLAIEQQYSTKVFNNINQCRIYLHVLTLSDITDPSGKYIEPEFFQHKQANTLWISSSINIHVTKPNKSLWHYWQTFLKILTLPNSRKLKSSLGNWTVPLYRIRRKYKTYRDSQFTFTKEKNQYIKTHIINKNKEMTNTLPETCIPCTILSSSIIPTQYISNFIQTTKRNNTPVITYQLKDGEHMLIISDASVQREKASYAWIFVKETGEIIQQHQARIHENYISSFRAEAFGVYSALQQLSEVLVTKKLRWTLYCDNQALIHRLKTIYKYEVNHEWIDSDILQNIKTLLPSKGNFEHVKGHQTPSDTLNIQEKMNILVDKQANIAINEEPQILQLHGTMQIFGNTTQLFSTQDVVRYCRTVISENYWKKRLGTSQFNLINWEIYQEIANKFKNQMSIIKLLTGLTPTRARLFKINQHHSPVCPLCNTTNENISHVIICPKNKENIWNNIDQICGKLRKHGEVDQFIKIIIENIQTDNNSTNEVPYQDQIHIGWSQVLQGKVAATLQSALTQYIKKKDTESKVLYEILINLIQQWKQAWIHRLNFTMEQDSKTITQAMQQTNNHKLEYIYKNIQYLDDSNKKLLLPNIQEHKKQSSNNIDTWLKIHHKSIDIQIRRKKNEEKILQNSTRVNHTPCEARAATMTK
jgi:Reverse transcriptase (RNA-dependent DNA polymerase)